MLGGENRSSITGANSGPDLSSPPPCFGPVVLVGNLLSLCIRKDVHAIFGCLIVSLYIDRVGLKRNKKNLHAHPPVSDRSPHYGRYRRPAFTSKILMVVSFIGWWDLLFLRMTSSCLLEQWKYVRLNLSRSFHRVSFFLLPPLIPRMKTRVGYSSRKWD